MSSLTPKSKLVILLFLLTVVVSVLASGHVWLAVTFDFIVAGVAIRDVRRARQTTSRPLPLRRVFWLGPTAILAPSAVAVIVGSIAMALLRGTPSSASLRSLPISDTLGGTWAGILFVIMVAFMRRGRFKNALIMLPLSFLPYVALPTWPSGANLFVFLVMQVTAWATCVLLLMWFGTPLRSNQIRPL